MNRLLTAIGALVFVLAVARPAPAQNDPRIGTWKLNVAKSKFDPAAARKGETRTYELSGGIVKVHVETVRSDGSKQELSFNGTADGKEYPYTANPPFYADTVSVRRSGHGFIGTSKKDGKLLFTTTDSFSADGKTMTMTTKGANANGESVNSVRVYEKQ
jgi:hypothetical protein